MGKTRRNGSPQPANADRATRKKTKPWAIHKPSGYSKMARKMLKNQGGWEDYAEET